MANVKKDFSILPLRLGTALRLPWRLHRPSECGARGQHKGKQAGWAEPGAGAATATAAAATRHFPCGARRTIADFLRRRGLFLVGFVVVRHTDGRVGAARVAFLLGLPLRA